MKSIDIFGPSKPTRRRSELAAESGASAPSEYSDRPRKPRKVKAAKVYKERKPRPPRDPQAPRVPTISARGAIFNCLARREHSAQEIRTKLAFQGHEAEAIEQALAAAIEAGYQSDSRYAASMVRFKAGRIGERKMRMLLSVQKIDKETQDVAMEEAEPEIIRAVTTLRNKFERRAPDPKLRQKAIAFMAGRGFGFEVISQAWKVVFESKELDDYLYP